VDGGGDGKMRENRGDFLSDTTRLRDDAWGMHIGA
jgi:hypothetical protein